MDFDRFNRPKCEGFDNGSSHFVINLPDRQILHVISRSLLFALVVFTLPCIVSILGPDSGSELLSDMIDSERLDLLFRDLGREGLDINGHKALFFSSVAAKGMTQVRVLDGHEHKLDIVLDSGFDRNGLFSDDSFDFVFVWGLVDSDFLDRIVKVGGIVAFPIDNNDTLNRFQMKPNYRPVFLNRYSSIIVALEKIAISDKVVYASASRRRHLCQFSLQIRKSALRGLEDALLEPPHEDILTIPNKLGRKINYLPNLIDGYLEHSRRRILVTVGLREENSNMVQYFAQNYPRKDQEFEVHKIDLEPDESLSGVEVGNTVSDWLRESVREEDFVVMKAEAEVVEELMKMRTMYLVDELFLDCKNQWWDDGSEKKSKRAYWECLYLYGSLKDLGVAVHQWWG